MEKFFQDYQHTIEVLAALGTWAAVVTALWLARDSSRPKLKIYVDRRPLILSEEQDRERETGRPIDIESCNKVVIVEISNNGSRITYIPYFSFSWNFPRFISFIARSAIGAMHNPVTDFRQDGLKIEPGQSASVILANNLEALKSDVFVRLCRKNRLPLFMRRFINLYVWTADGHRVRARKGTGLVEIIDSAVLASTTPSSRSTNPPEQGSGHGA